ncbi:MAG: hypothetical protein HUJ29_10775 [Gammaproteobacteria bacterium]|nr:hypothetical protein [Gammaproteobacteria bacterium]
MSFSNAVAEGWDDYKPGLISFMISDYKEQSKDSDYFFTPGMPFKANVEFLGEFRKIEENRSKYIGMWLKTHGMNPEHINMYSTEVLVKEGKVEYWLPIQKQLIPYFKKEVPNNKRVNLYVVLAGSIHKDWVFLVNEFRVR